MEIVTLAQNFTMGKLSSLGNSSKVNCHEHLPQAAVAPVAIYSLRGLLPPRERATAAPIG